MKPKQYKTFLKKMLIENPKQAIYVSGGGGIGKSETNKQVAEELNFKFSDIRLSLLDATDLRGMPIINKENKTTEWTRPIFLPIENEDIILFFDEFSNASPSIQNACLQLCLDRQLGEYKLPDKVRVVLAGNTLKDGAYVYKLSSALNNRFVNITFEPDLSDWEEWAYNNNINPLIISFHKFTEGRLLHNYNNKVEGAFATPRSWFFVNRILNLGFENGLLKEAIAGCIGEGASIEFLGYLKIYRDLPDLDKIISGEDIIPQEANILYAVITSLVAKGIKNSSIVNRLLDYANKLPAEFSMMMIKDMLKTSLRETMRNTEQYRDWILKNKDLIVG